MHRLGRLSLPIHSNLVIQSIGTDKPILTSSPTGVTCFPLNLGMMLDCLSQIFAVEIGYHSTSFETISGRILEVPYWRNAVLAMSLALTYAPVTPSKITLKGIWDG